MTSNKSSFNSKNILEFISMGSANSSKSPRQDKVGLLRNLQAPFLEIIVSNSKHDDKE